MLRQNVVTTGTIGPAVTPQREVPMGRQERWEEIRRLSSSERVSIAEIVWRLELDRKTVRRCLRDAAWAPYQRPPRPDTGHRAGPACRLSAGAPPQVGYSAQFLFQELRQRGYPGSYDTVKLFVRPLRVAGLGPERALVRFETPPGQQSCASGS